MKKRIWQRPDVLALLALAGLLLSLAAAGVGRSTPSYGAVPAPLPTETPQPTPTGGWWDHVSMTPGPRGALPGIPSLPQLQAGGGSASGPAGNQPVAFTAVTCPQATVKIAKIVTGRPGWWLVTGTAAHASLSYWKMELSADGQNWTMLYRNSTAVAGGQLLDFNTRTVPAGAYQLRLVVVDKTGNYADPCIVSVNITR